MNHTDHTPPQGEPFCENCTKEIADDLRGLESQYDTRLVAAHLLMESASLYRALLAAHIHSKDDVMKCFSFAMENALAPRDPPPIAYTPEKITLN